MALLSLFYTQRARAGLRFRILDQRYAGRQAAPALSTWSFQERALCAGGWALGSWKVWHAFKVGYGSIAHWGVGQYLALLLVWVVSSIPFYQLGWGIASVLGFPLLIVMGVALTAGVVRALKLLDRPVREPTPLRTEPRELVHPLLGTFVLNACGEEYEGKVDWLGQQVTLSLGMELLENWDVVIAQATELWQRREEVAQAVGKMIQAELLETVNEQRTAGSESVFDGAGLLQAITLEQVMIDADGRYFFAFADGDLLGGHAIEVTGYLDRGPTDLGLFG
jgi:hypothetical protein